MLSQSNKPVNIHVKDKNGWNALLSVCFCYRGKYFLELIQLFIRKDIDVSCACGRGLNCLFALFSKAQDRKDLKDNRLLQIVQSLVDAGLNPNAKTKGGLNVLIPLILRRFNHKHFVEILKFLVFKGLDVNAKSVEGVSP